jgi:hypothetical protein
MTQRTQTTSVTLRTALPCLGPDRTLPPGQYIVETLEEVQEGPSFPPRRLTLVLVHGVRDASRAGGGVAWSVDPDELHGAVERGDALLHRPLGRLD